MEELASHGGSLRIYACRAEDQTHVLQPNVGKVIGDEKRRGLDSLEGLREFRAASEADQAGAAGLPG